MTHIFLSPHPDDGIFSCGGLITKLVNQGNEVQVITIYSVMPSAENIPPKLRKYIDYSDVLEEDKAALSFLGAKYHHKGILSSVFIDPEKTFKPVQIFKAPKQKMKGFKNLNTIKNEIAEIISKTPRPIIYIPFGIGNHIDHMEIFFAAMRYLAEGGNPRLFRFYEDNYAMSGPGMRKKHPIACRFIPENTYHYPSLSGRIMAAVMTGAVDLSPVINAFGHLTSPFHWQLEKVEIRNEYEAKKKATLMYESQIKQFGGAQKYQKFLDNYVLNYLQGHELYWEVQ